MGRVKTDYSALKLEFFQSDIHEIKGFIESKWRKWSWNYGKMTKWRHTEKQRRLKRVEEKALERAAKEAAKAVELDMTKIKKAKRNAVNILIWSLNNWVKKDWTIKKTISVNDVKWVLNSLKIELHEPIIVSKSHSTVVSEDLTPEERAEVEEARGEDEVDI